MLAIQIIKIITIVANMSHLKWRDHMVTMDYPFFSLSRYTVTEPLRIDFPDQKYVVLIPSIVGMPTMFDKDLYILGFSKLVSFWRRNPEEESPPEISVDLDEYRTHCKKGKGGAQTKEFVKAMQRLNGLVVETDVIQHDSGGKVLHYHILEGSELTYTINKRGTKELTGLKMQFPKWIWEDIKTKGMKKIHPDYFKLTSALAKRIYEVGTKYVHGKKERPMSLELLQAKCANTSQLKTFKQEVKRCLQKTNFPQLKVLLEGDSVLFHSTYL